jgi:hypothetical protein
LKNRQNDVGYERVKINKMECYVHRLVALAFFGEPPSKNHQVDHLDSNRTNNFVTNLQYVTGKENTTRSCGKRVKCTDLNTKEIHYFSSLTEAGTSINRTQQAIGQSIKARRTIDNFLFEFVSESS